MSADIFILVCLPAYMDVCLQRRVYAFCKAAILGLMNTLDSLLSDVNLCDTVSKRSVYVCVCVCVCVCVWGEDA